MKRITVVIFCVLLVCALPLTVCAAGAETEEVGMLISEKFEEWVVPHLEEISVIVTLLFSCVFQFRKNRLLTKSMGTMNNNTVAVAEQSADMMEQARAGLENAALAVRGYEEKMETLLDAYRTTAEDRERLAAEIREMREYSEKAAEANIEFSNELAELLSLANIPDYKKEEIGERHLAAVRAIRQTPVKEAKGDDREKA